VSTVCVRNADRDTVLGAEVEIADDWWRRLRGLLGRPPLKPGEGLLISPCRSVHMYGMKFGLDVVFISRDGRVVGLYEALAPGRLSRWHRDALHALEVPPGTIATSQTRLGDHLSWHSAGENA
jgi:uncharacterized membrane protein (UPF0127 family)